MFKFFKIVIFLFFSPLLFIMRILSPFILIRFHRINCYRLGHFMPNVELYLCEKKFFKKNNKFQFIFDIHFYEPPLKNSNIKICNSQADLMIKRVINKTANLWRRWIVKPIKKIWNWLISWVK